jgi:NTP pyrophosphatase (non-canonical NTP hydrolase)
MDPVDFRTDPLPPEAHPRTLVQWCRVAYENSKAHGFHDDPLDGTPERMPIRIALLHSEVTELFEAFRKDPNAPTDKPGVQLSAAAEELADIVIRLFDFIMEFGIDPEEVFSTAKFSNTRYLTTDLSLGEKICNLHRAVDRIGIGAVTACKQLYAQCASFAVHHHYDLELAVQRKHAYNVTRPHMHGKKF